MLAKVGMPGKSFVCSLKPYASAISSTPVFCDANTGAMICSLISAKTTPGVLPREPFVEDRGGGVRIASVRPRADMKETREARRCPTDPCLDLS